jgi:glycosyltransferase involved in cell wall biosynthesis
MNPIVSVIICSHNPRPDYLQRVVGGLREQSLPDNQWELLLIDNASKKPLAGACDLSWHPHCRHIREDKLGLAIARQRGIKEAAAELLVFVDDDNVVRQNYLVEAIKIAQGWPQLGVWGGSISPEFEVDPPESLHKFLGYLALREVRTARWTNVVECSEALPCGAGLCVRRSVAAAYVKHYREAQLKLTGRKAGSLVSGDDTELCYIACSLGLGFGMFPELALSHLIPADRLEEQYILRLVEGIHTSGHLLDYKWHAKFPGRPRSIREMLRIALNLCTMRGVDRRVYLAGLRGASLARAMLEGDKP